MRKWTFWSFFVRGPFGLLQVYAGETVQVHEKTLEANYRRGTEASSLGMLAVNGGRLHDGTSAAVQRGSFASSLITVLARRCGALLPAVTQP